MKLLKKQLSFLALMLASIPFSFPVQALELSASFSRYFANQNEDLHKLMLNISIGEDTQRPIYSAQGSMQIDHGTYRSDANFSDVSVKKHSPVPMVVALP